MTTDTITVNGKGWI